MREQSTDQQGKDFADRREKDSYMIKRYESKKERRLGKRNAEEARYGKT